MRDFGLVSHAAVVRLFRGVIGVRKWRTVLQVFHFRGFARLVHHFSGKQSQRRK